MVRDQRFAGPAEGQVGRLAVELGIGVRIDDPGSAGVRFALEVGEGEHLVVGRFGVVERTDPEVVAGHRGQVVEAFLVPVVVAVAPAG
jgi:hypothetical protein